MNYFKARYFGAKTNYTWTLPPDETPDVIEGGSSYNEGKRINLLEKRKREERDVKDILNIFFVCNN